MKSKMVLVVLVFALIFVSAFTLCYKPSIHTATTKDLEEIYGIGSILANRIESYLDTNPQADIDDLMCVDGIGEVKLSYIKKEWGD